MNLLYMKYALEIASCGSLNKAAENLYVNQPNLSRAIKELESSLGVTLFRRSSTGMTLTPDGEKFVSYAKTILSQVDAVEELFRNGTAQKKRFSISVPRASYISEAFSAFSKNLSAESAVEVFYKETNALRAIKNIMEADYKLGIIRYAKAFDKYYKDMLSEKGLEYELITEFRYVLIMSEHAPLSNADAIRFTDLTKLIEIAHADPYVPYLPFSEVKKEELPDIDRRIFVFERASQFELLAENPDTFMWVSPVPEKLLRRYGLVQRVCEENQKLYKDVLVRRKDYHLSELDNAFISELCRVKREQIDSAYRV
ncbi:MAG: LysR family transcriptional regulator [Eubacteriales bacterium]|nr:LysR family transcriptional regulator [Eubacteriales bacterium]